MSEKTKKICWILLIIVVFVVLKIVWDKRSPKPPIHKPPVVKTPYPSPPPSSNHVNMILPTQGWEFLPERHYDDENYIMRMKNKYLPPKIRNIENAQEGLEREERYIRKLLRADPNNKDLLYLLAYNQFDREKYDEAKKVFEKILKLYPNERLATVGRVYCFSKKEEFREARREALKALKKFPNSPRLHHILGVTYVYGADRDLKKAVEIYKKAIKLDPKDPRIWLGYAECYIEMKTPQASDKAIEIMKETIRRFPQYHIVYILLAEEYQLRGEYKKAIYRLEQSIDRDPLYYRAYSIIGDIFKDLGEYEKALPFYIRTLKTNPRYEALIYIKLGRLYKILGDPETAKKYFLESLKVHKGSPRDEKNQEKAIAYNELARMCIEKKDFKKAEEYIKNAMDSYPDSEYTRYTKSLLYLAKGEYEKARKEMEGYLTCEPSEDSLEPYDIYYGLATVEAGAHHPHKAIEYLKEAIKRANKFKKVDIINRTKRDPYFADVRKTEEYKKILKKLIPLMQKAHEVKVRKKYWDLLKNWQKPKDVQDGKVSKEGT